MCTCMCVNFDVYVYVCMSVYVCVYVCVRKYSYPWAGGRRLLLAHRHSHRISAKSLELKNMRMEGDKISSSRTFSNQKTESRVHKNSWVTQNSRPVIEIGSPGPCS
jgi:hypothetical protein